MTLQVELVVPDGELWSGNARMVIAKTLDGFLTKAHAFVGDPPQSTLSLTRANGDTLMFDPASGLFAVARKDGAPRTVFKPDDGMAYWRAQQSQAEGSNDTAPRSSRARPPTSARCWP